MDVVACTIATDALSAWEQCTHHHMCKRGKTVCGFQGNGVQVIICRRHEKTVWGSPFAR